MQNSSKIIGIMTLVFRRDGEHGACADARIRGVTLTERTNGNDNRRARV